MRQFEPSCFICLWPRASNSPIGDRGGSPKVDLSFSFSSRGQYYPLNLQEQPLCSTCSGTHICKQNMIFVQFVLYVSVLFFCAVDIVCSILYWTIVYYLFGKRVNKRFVSSCSKFVQQHTCVCFFVLLFCVRSCNHTFLSFFLLGVSIVFYCFSFSFATQGKLNHHIEKMYKTIEKHTNSSKKGIHIVGVDFNA